ncbi:MAG: PH domain-containing protein [Propionibacteriaceae bacterium]|nr:PH domain-containing protein [Propionibacteriaceae bacterium]
MDRFVVTNMRVFRVHGVLKRDIATIPLMRILDITVHQTLTGMIFNYGHLTFESAASQGMRKITFVANPKSRDLIIQGVIHRSGVRRAASAVVVADGT